MRFLLSLYLFIYLFIGGHLQVVKNVAQQIYDFLESQNHLPGTAPIIHRLHGCVILYCMDLFLLVVRVDE